MVGTRSVFYLLCSLCLSYVKRVAAVATAARYILFVLHIHCWFALIPSSDISAFLWILHTRDIRIGLLRGHFENRLPPRMLATGAASCASLLSTSTTFHDFYLGYCDRS